MNIVHDGVGVFDDDFLIGLHGKNVGSIFATFLVQDHRGCRCSIAFASDAFQHDEYITETLVFTDHVKVRCDGLSMEFAASGIRRDLGIGFFRWGRSFNRYSAGNIARERTLH